MAARCETFEHTADVGLRVRGDSWAEVLTAAAEGLYRLQFDPPAGGGPLETREIDVRADGRDELLRRWLRELLYLQQVHRFVMLRCEFHDLDATGCRATLYGQVVDVSSRASGPEVKAITYYGLRVVEENGGLLAEVVVDI